ncbi:hypothetical protein [Streptomyces gibsoniae]|uniref:Uncharacterized protein n=1 Tax=Streptomyces gibsoniae TaxID=3075529 RepID=A0ABU2TKD3_9ACTN|nr:hypothetical protein [Streptomyces sp. DSM 41699]MDT0461404.1 hypothetical protein [Streptomyces sp. DSM 41699]
MSTRKRRGALAVMSVLLAGAFTAPAAAAEAPAPRSDAPGSLSAQSAVPQGMPNDIVINHQITFSGGVPVGGWYTLSVFPSGAYNYSGHVHVSGFPSYNFSGVCVTRFTNGTAFVFMTSGRLHGTWEDGSRDHDWNRSGTRRAITDAWKASGGGWTTSCSNQVNASVDSMIDATIKRIGSVAQVISILA